jgi:predicted site-specific integrase-resolvase
MSASLGIHPQTLRRWERTGKMPQPARTAGNHRRYLVKPQASDALVIGYVRVASHDQKAALKRQSETVVAQAINKPDLIISDLGSGLNYKKPGFKRLLLLILQGKVKELILTHKDRLLRFGSEIIFSICSFMHVKLTVLNDTPDKPPMESFCTDLVEIMTVFCSKIYGHRSHQNRKCSTLIKNNATAA